MSCHAITVAQGTFIARTTFLSYPKLHPLDVENLTLGRPWVKYLPLVKGNFWRGTQLRLLSANTLSS